MTVTSRPLGVVIACALHAALALAPRVAHPDSPLTNWREIARRVVPAVVNISVSKIDREQHDGGIGARESFSGSGFLIDPNGDIVTNKHVIDGAFRITVMLRDGTELPAKLVAAASMVDLAVLKVDSPRPLPFLKLAGDDAVAIGDPVLAVGNPLGLGTSLSSGIVSAINRDLRNSPFDDYVQTDAAINHGNSGGPLINSAGEVIGVNTILLTNLKDEGSNGLGFAISSTVVGYVVRHLKDPSAAPVGWIGTHVEDITSDLALARHVPGQKCCIVTEIDPNSPAQKAGVHPGDVILRYDDHPLTDARAFMRQVVTTQIGRDVALELCQNGKTGTAHVVVQAWPHLMESRGTMTVVRPVEPPDLGLLMAPLTEMARKQYRLEGVQGVLVVAVDQQSEAFGKGVAPGEVIEQVQGQPVTAPSQVMHLVQEARSSGGVVALLVLWRNGPHWIALHTGGEQAEARMVVSSPDGGLGPAQGLAVAPTAPQGPGTR